jgi:hypothetical protein
MTDTSRVRHPDPRPVIAATMLVMAAVVLCLPAAALARAAARFARSSAASPLVSLRDASRISSRVDSAVSLGFQRIGLTPADPAAGVSFGDAVAISGDTAVVGAPQQTVGGRAGAGAAHVFVNVGGVWSQAAELTGSDPAAKDGFGGAVALDGDTALIGASGKAVGGQPVAGAAYVFVRSGTRWSQQIELTAPSPAAQDGFGGAVALNGDTALIGAWGTGDPLEDTSGTAYVFVRSGAIWSQQATLKDPDDTAGDEFGYSVALDGDTALIGADGDLALGAAYFYSRTDGRWSLQRTLEDPTVESNLDGFGSAVALRGDTALIGDPLLDSGGVTYVFKRSGTKWPKQATLSDHRQSDFGTSVALDGGTALVGSTGTAYVYVHSGAGWSQSAELLAPGGGGDKFGSSVALSGTLALVGDAGSEYSGALTKETAYVEDLNTLPTLTLKATALSRRLGQRVKLTGLVTNAVAGQRTVLIKRRVGRKLILLKKVTITGDGAFRWTLQPASVGKWVVLATYKVGGAIGTSAPVTVAVRR